MATTSHPTLKPIRGCAKEFHMFVDVIKNCQYDIDHYVIRGLGDSQQVTQLREAIELASKQLALVSVEK
jgi:hypothetical protein